MIRTETKKKMCLSAHTNFSPLPVEISRDFFFFFLRGRRKWKPKKGKRQEKDCGNMCECIYTHLYTVNTNQRDTPLWLKVLLSIRNFELKIHALLDASPWISSISRHESIFQEVQCWIWKWREEGKTEPETFFLKFTFWLTNSWEWRNITGEKNKWTKTPKKLLWFQQLFSALLLKCSMLIFFHSIKEMGLLYEISFTGIFVTDWCYCDPQYFP